MLALVQHIVRNFKTRVAFSDYLIYCNEELGQTECVVEIERKS